MVQGLVPVFAISANPISLRRGEAPPKLRCFGIAELPRRSSRYGVTGRLASRAAAARRVRAREARPKQPRSARWMTSPVAHLGPPLLTKFKEGDRMGPNGCLMPKRLFFSTLTRLNCEPYKHAAIFLKKIIFCCTFCLPGAYR